MYAGIGVRLISGVVLAACLGVCASAQDTQSNEKTETVTVFGHREINADTLPDIIDDFIEGHAASSRRTGLMVRFAKPGICPVTVGLPADYNTFVTDRIIAVAKEVGAPVKQDCEWVNLEVIFTPYPQKMVDILAKKTKGLILGFYYIHEKNDLMQIKHPIQSWYATGTIYDPATAFTKNLDLLSLVGSNPGILSRYMDIGPHNTSTLDREDGRIPPAGTGSHIPPRHQGQIVNVLIVVDQNMIGGLEIGPVADYIAMLALSYVDTPKACNELPSILDLFATNCGSRPKPHMLTDSDFIFLKALYSADITTSGAYGRATVKKKMTEGITGEH